MPTDASSKRPSVVRWVVIAIAIALVGALLAYGPKGWRLYKKNKKHVTWENAREVVSNTVSSAFASGDPYDRLPELEKEFTPEKLKSVSRAGGNWILEMQETRPGSNQGRFLYQYNPEEGDPPKGFASDNFLRQAGTVYSLIMLYETVGDAKYLEGAELGAKYLLTRHELVPDKPGMSWFIFEKDVKLGGNALPLLGLVKLKSIRSTDQYDKVIRETADHMVAEQQEDGEYRSFAVYRGKSCDDTDALVADPKVREKCEWDSNIYPGEAMLALARAWAAFGDPKYKASIDRAIGFYGSSKDRWANPAFIPWTTTAMVEMWELTGEEHYSELAFRMTDRIINNVQNLKPTLDFFGAFHKKPSVNTGTYLEGVLDAYRLSVHLGDRERQQLYRLSAYAGYGFLVTLQYDAKMASAYSPHERLLVGGFKSAPNDPAVRIDNTQHSVSALVKGAQYLATTPPRLPLRQP